MIAPPTLADIAEPPVAGGPSTTERIENELARRIFRIVASADALLLGLYTVLYAAHGRWIITGLLLAQWVPLAWAVRVEAPRARHVQALLVVFWPLYAMVTALAVVQGGVLGTAAWWLMLPPVALMQVGAMRSGMAMAVMAVATLLACHVLHAAGLLPVLLDRPLGDIQMPLAVLGSTVSVVGMVWIGVRWRRDLLRTLDTLRARAEEATRVKSRFIANMSHEIRTPLNGIVGAAELLRLSGLDAGQAQAAQIIDHSAQALLAAVNDILDFSKLEAGRVELEKIGLDPAALAYDTAETFAGQVHARGVEFWAHATAAVPGLIQSDPVRVRQILHNLVSNAMKFTEAGEIRVEVDVRPGALGTPELRFAVRDTGIGLDEFQQARLFQAFTQADLSTTRRFGGTGLGLVICRELAQLLGGRLELQSVPGVGSTFSFVLPLDGSTVAEPAAPRSPRPALPSIVGCFACDAMGLDMADWAQRAGYRIERASGGSPDDWLDLARAVGAEILLVDDEALRRSGISRGTWAARLRRTGCHGVLLLGVSVPIVAVPEGLVPLYKPARPLRLEGALREARRMPAPRHDALVGIPSDPTPAGPAPSTTRPEPEPAAVDAAPSADEQAAAHATVLLVEDNPVNQAVARALLAQLKVDAEVAEDGSTALEMLEHAANDYAVVLMDCHMPVLDGYAATRAWRVRESALGRNRLPVIAMTANSLADAGAACVDAGMDDFMAKPFTLGELARVLARWLPRPTPA